MSGGGFTRGAELSLRRTPLRSLSWERMCEFQIRCSQQAFIYRVCDEQMRARNGSEGVYVGGCVSSLPHCTGLGAWLNFGFCVTLLAKTI